MPSWTDCICPRHSLNFRFHLCFHITNRVYAAALIHGFGCTGSFVAGLRDVRQNSLSQLHYSCAHHHFRALSSKSISHRRTLVVCHPADRQRVAWGNKPQLSRRGAKCAPPRVLSSSHPPVLSFLTDCFPVP